MAANAKTYSVGELAKVTGLTVRTLQHYDNIGLLPPSGRTEGGRRYYTDHDMIRLTQIVFYKSVGISLSEIREKLLNTHTPVELEAVFNQHISMVLLKIDALHMTLSVLNSTIELLHSGNVPPFEILAQLIRGVEGSGLQDWATFKFKPALNADLEGDEIATLDGAMHFYHTMRALMVEAVAMKNADTAADSLAALSLGRRWWEDIIQRIAAFGDDATTAALDASNSREKWPAADRKLFEAAEPFLEAALAAYLAKNNMEVPTPRTGGETQ